jgi:hypothetical protein
MLKVTEKRWFHQDLQPLVECVQNHHNGNIAHFLDFHKEPQVRFLVGNRYEIEHYTLQKTLLPANSDQFHIIPSCNKFQKDFPRGGKIKNNEALIVRILKQIIDFQQS